MNFRLIESEAALTYPEEIRAEAVKLSKTYSLVHPLSFFLMGATILTMATICVLLRDYVNNFMQSFLCFMGAFLVVRFVIPIFVGRRILLSRKDEILRVIQGGFNGPDKSLKVPSEK